MPTPPGHADCSKAATMKKSSLIPTFGILASLALLTGPVHADLTGSEIFTAADLDLSGSLGKEEFGTTLDAGITARAINKKFRAADANRNDSIQLNEFLIFQGSLAFNNKLERKFLLADANLDGSLTFEEFIATAGAKASIVSIRRGFFRADLDDNESVTLNEWLNFRRGNSPAGNTYTIFQLADFDRNNDITLLEFSFWFKRGASEVRILNKFTKLDRNNDGLLTVAEWNPGVR